MLSVHERERQNVECYLSRQRGRAKYQAESIKRIKVNTFYMSKIRYTHDEVREKEKRNRLKCTGKAEKNISRWQQKGKVKINPFQCTNLKKSLEKGKERHR